MVVLNLSVLTSVRRIVKIAVRFLHTKTALCDRKDTQSRFAVNAARSIVCVETSSVPFATRRSKRFQCRTQHCVCRDYTSWHALMKITPFQCRTQHCVCRDAQNIPTLIIGLSFNAARSIVCVETEIFDVIWAEAYGFNAARSIVCVETKRVRRRKSRHFSFNAARSIVCVETRMDKSLIPHGGSFNAARSIVCVETAKKI